MHTYLTKNGNLMNYKSLKKCSKLVRNVLKVVFKRAATDLEKVTKVEFLFNFSHNNFNESLFR